PDDVRRGAERDLRHGAEHFPARVTAVDDHARGGNAHPRVAAWPEPRVAVAGGRVRDLAVGAAVPREHAAERHHTEVQGHPEAAARLEVSTEKSPSPLPLSLCDCVAGRGEKLRYKSLSRSETHRERDLGRASGQART